MFDLAIIVFHDLIQAFFDHGLAKEIPLGIIHPVVEPVVTDRESSAHLASIEKMIRIPVREFGGVFKFCIAALSIFFITEDVVCQGKSRNAALYSFRLFENPYSADELILDRIICIRIYFAVSFFFELREKLGSCRSVIKMGFQFSKLVIGHYDPGMTILTVFFDHGTDDIGAACKGAVTRGL